MGSQKVSNFTPNCKKKTYKIKYKIQNLRKEYEEYLLWDIILVTNKQISPHIRIAVMHFFVNPIISQWFLILG